MFMQYKVNQATYAKAIKLLIEDTSSAYELAEATGLHTLTAQSLLRCFKEHKLVHISGWDTDGMGRDVTPVYSWGKGRDKPRHKLTDAERQHRYKANKALREAQTLLFNGDKE